MARVSVHPDAAHPFEADSQDPNLRKGSWDLVSKVISRL